MGFSVINSKKFNICIYIKTLGALHQHVFHVFFKLIQPESNNIENNIESSYLWHKLNGNNQNIGKIILAFIQKHSYIEIVRGIT